MRTRSELRGRWRSTLLIVLLIGITGGVALTAAAGARRTDTAYPRFLEANNASDFLVSAFEVGHGLYSDIARLPEVAQTGVVDGVPYFYLPGPKHAADPTVQFVASDDGKAGYSIERLHMLSGRAPRPDRADEVAVTRAFQQRFHVGPGDQIRMVQISPASGRTVFDTQGRPMTRTFTVTGVEVTFDEVIPIAPNDAYPQVFGTPALAHPFAARGQLDYDGTLVRLRPGASPARFRADVERLVRRHPEAGGHLVADEFDHHARVQRAIRPEALALAIFALLTAIAGLLAIAQILSRRIFLDASDYPTLRSLGMSEQQLVAVGAIRGTVVAIGGGILAVLIAFLASPLMPIGPARIAEPNPGFELNVAILGVGFVVILLSIVGVGALAGWRAARSAGTTLGTAEVVGADRPSRVAAHATKAGLGPSVVSGVRFALEPGRGHTAVPVRTAMVGLVVAIAAVTGSLTFGTNLSRLVSTPGEYGRTWDIDLDTGFGGIPRSKIMAVFGGDPDVAAFAGGDYSQATIGDLQVPVAGLDALEGSVTPTIIEGRGPQNQDEIALGGKTLRQLGASIGDQLDVELTGMRHHMRVVGKAVFPSLGQGSFNPTGLGEGALTQGSVIRSPYFPANTYAFVVARFDPGVDTAAAIRRLGSRVSAAKLCPTDQECEFRTVQLPAELTTYAGIKTVPLVLALLLIAMGVAVTVHTLVTSVQRRRRDLATLKTIGFVRHQVLTTVMSQGSVFALIGLALGIPLGVVAGRWAWTAFAEQLGVPPSPVVPLVVVGIAVPATLLLAILAAALPGRAAARTHPALVLRTE
jgi:putative ABC transport system permease protein